MAICEKKNLDKPPALHQLTADYYFLRGDFRNASEEAELALERAREDRDDAAIVVALRFLGTYYMRTGFYKESVDYYNEAIALARSKKLKGIIPGAYQGLGNLYNTIGDIPQYQENLKLMAASAFEEQDSTGAEEALLRLGTSLTDKLRNFREADSVLKKCLRLSLIRRDTFYTAFSSANLGWNFYREEMYDSARFYYKNSLHYCLPFNQYGIAANSYGNLGTIARDLKEYNSALVYYRQAISFAEKAGDWYSLSWVNNDMHDLYLRINDTANAYKSYVRYKQFNDSVLIKNNTQGLADARIRYEADTHSKEVELLNLRLKNNRLLNYGFAGLLFLTTLIGLLLLRAYRLQNQKKMIEMKRQIAEITQANLRQQMNPHFIFNTLNSIQYYMYQHDKLATNNYLTKFSNLMRKVLENSQQPSIPLKDELQALNLYLELESIRFKEKFEYSVDVDEEIDPLQYKVPAMLIQPYVENSICHGLMPREGGKGFVRIAIRPDNGSLLCVIEDNGIGRQAAAGRKQKNNNGEHNSLGTKIVSSRLDLVNALYGTSLRTHYTDLKDGNGEPAGTRVEIHIPVII